VHGATAAEIIANNRESGFAVIGTPHDVIAKIEELIEASDGGFGAFCCSTMPGRRRRRNGTAMNCSRST
jgi:alkanesulfonate monooxygenase SsuD/methylene tetrahydromethanopterin reductase-like flavin-dependent oxidoreductase (luciferase family)